MGSILTMLGLGKVAAKVAGGAFTKYILIGAVTIMLSLGGWIGIERYRVAKLENEVSTLQVAILKKEVAIQELNGTIEVQKFTIEQNRKLAEVAERRAEETQKERDEYERRLDEIINSPDSEDGPVAPVLRNYFERGSR